MLEFNQIEYERHRIRSIAPPAPLYPHSSLRVVYEHIKCIQRRLSKLHLSPGFVQQATPYSSAGAASASCSLSGVSASNSLIAIIAVHSASRTIQTPTGGGGTWTKVTGGVDGGTGACDFEIWWSPTTTGGSVTVSMTPTGSGNIGIDMMLYEVSGITTVDTSNTNWGDSTASNRATPNTGTLSSANSFVLGAVFNVGTTAPTSGPNNNFGGAAYTGLTSANSASRLLQAGYCVTTSTTATGCYWAYAASAYFDSAIAVFYIPSPSGPLMKRIHRPRSLITVRPAAPKGLSGVKKVHNKVSIPTGVPPNFLFAHRATKTTPTPKPKGHIPWLEFLQLRKLIQPPAFELGVPPKLLFAHGALVTSNQKTPKSRKPWLAFLRNLLVLPTGLPLRLIHRPRPHKRRNYFVNVVHSYRRLRELVQPPAANLGLPLHLVHHPRPHKRLSYFVNKIHVYKRLRELVQPPTANLGIPPNLLFARLRTPTSLSKPQNKRRPWLEFLRNLITVPTGLPLKLIHHPKVLKGVNYFTNRIHNYRSLRRAIQPPASALGVLPSLIRTKGFVAKPIKQNFLIRNYHRLVEKITPSAAGSGLSGNLFRTVGAIAKPVKSRFLIRNYRRLLDKIQPPSSALGVLPRMLVHRQKALRRPTPMFLPRRRRLFSVAPVAFRIIRRPKPLKQRTSKPLLLRNRDVVLRTQPLIGIYLRRRVKANARRVLHLRIQTRRRILVATMPTSILLRRRVRKPSVIRTPKVATRRRRILFSPSKFVGFPIKLIKRHRILPSSVTPYRVVRRWFRKYLGFLFPGPADIQLVLPAQNSISLKVIPAQDSMALVLSGQNSITLNEIPVQNGIVLILPPTNIVVET